jgi:hypothetical protein
MLRLFVSFGVLQQHSRRCMGACLVLGDVGAKAMWVLAASTPVAAAGALAGLGSAGA